MARTFHPRTSSPVGKVLATTAITTNIIVTEDDAASAAQVQEEPEVVAEVSISVDAASPTDKSVRVCVCVYLRYPWFLERIMRTVAAVFLSRGSVSASVHLPVIYAGSDGNTPRTWAWSGVAPAEVPVHDPLIARQLHLFFTALSRVAA